MGTSNLRYYEGNYYQGNLSDEQCQVLEQLIELSEGNGSVPDLAHVIYDLPDATVDSMITDFMVGGFIPDVYEKPLGTLMDYQTIAVAFMYYSGCCLLGDSVGLGKTVEVAGLCNLLKVERGKQGKRHNFLLLTEKKVVEQVRSEMIRFTGDYVHMLSNAEADKIEEFVETFPTTEEINYSLVGSHSLIKADGFLSWFTQYKQLHGEPPFDTLIIDESTVLAGKSTNEIVKCFKLLRKSFDRVILMNATPFTSSLKGVYNQLDLLDGTFLPTKANFDKEYSIIDYRGMFPKPTGKYKNKDKFRQLVRLRYWASTRKANGAVMENCTGKIVLSELSPVQKRLLKESQLNSMVYDCPSYIDEEIEFNETNVPKLKSLHELFENECKDADTIIMYVYYREAQKHISEWLTNMGYSNRVLNGDTAEAESNEIIEGFKRQDYRVLITNAQKGLNFGDCNYCIFYGIDSSPSNMVQFEGRITRSFDIRDKNIFILCSLGKEYKNLKSVVKDRADSMVDTTVTDYSVVLDLLSSLMRK